MPNTTTNYGWQLPIVNDPIDADLWGGELNSNFLSQDTIVKQISDTANSATPNFGDMKATAASIAPSKWLLCDGSAISRLTYASLFTAIGTAYGIGDGSTTFNIPDTGGRVLAGKEVVATRLTSGVSGVNGAALGAAGGDQNVQLHTHTPTVTDTHKHNLFNNSNSSSSPSDAPSNTDNAAVASNTFSGSFASNYNIVKTTSPSATPANGLSSGSVQGSISVSNGNFGSGSSQNVQPTLIVNWLIYTGV